MKGKYNVKSEVPIIALRLVDNNNSSHKWNLCAVCFAGSRVLSFGYNKPKTEASIIEFAENVDMMYDTSQTGHVSLCRHAEIDAIKKVADTSKIDCLIVVRKIKDGTPSMARPCLICQQVIKEIGIKKIFFSNEIGECERFFDDDD